MCVQRGRFTEEISSSHYALLLFENKLYALASKVAARFYLLEFLCDSVIAIDATGLMRHTDLNVN
jgi:hypothetical protein